MLGSALLFWGGLSGHGLLGLALAFMVEAAHWTRLRWDFNDAACTRAWQLCIIAAALSMVFIWIDGDPYLMVPQLLGWLPVLLLPLQFVQTFGLRQALPARTFALFTRKQRELQHRHGLDPSAVHFNFGHVYLVGVMVAATPLGERPESGLFLPGLLVITLWALLGSGRCRVLPVILLLLVAGGIAVLGQIGLAMAYHWLNLSVLKGYDDFLNPSHYRTAIGHLGEIKQSANIHWRLRPQSGHPVPALLRSTCYNRYRTGLWINLTPPGLATTESDFKALMPADSGNSSPVYPLLAGAGQQVDSAVLPRFSLRGAATINSPLPLPGSAAYLRDFQVDAIERNSLGTVRIFPKDPVIDGSVAWGDTATAETAPWPEVDLDVQANERAALRQVLADLKLADHPSLAAKLEVLRRFFLKFQYTRYNTIEPPPIGVSKGPTAITLFLTTARRGHCEYFATAACLLLREAGIPSRYAIGYAVMEHDARRGEWVMRGRHGHAWARVWDERAARWLDFDPTPPGWLGAETRPGISLQWLLDGFHRMREDFALWRGRSQNRLLLTAVMFTLGGTGLVFILSRLWRSKRTLATPPTRRKNSTAAPSSPLHPLEKPAAKYLPPRLPGQPFCQWLSGLQPYLTDASLLDEAIRLHQQLRFDPAPPAPPDSQRLTHLTTLLARELDRMPRGHGRTA